MFFCDLAIIMSARAPPGHPERAPGRDGVLVIRRHVVAGPVVPAHTGQTSDKIQRSLGLS